MCLYRRYPSKGQRRRAVSVPALSTPTLSTPVEEVSNREEHREQELEERGPGNSHFGWSVSRDQPTVSNNENIYYSTVWPIQKDTACQTEPFTAETLIDYCNNAVFENEEVYEQVRATLYRHNIY